MSEEGHGTGLLSDGAGDTAPVAAGTAGTEQQKPEACNPEAVTQLSSGQRTGEPDCEQSEPTADSLAAEEVIISLKAQVHILQAKLGHYQTWLASVHIKVQQMNPQALKNSKRLYVGSLLPEVTEDELCVFLNSTLAQIGATIAPGDAVVACKIATDKGYAFAEFRSVEETSNALVLDGVMLRDRDIRLKIRRPSNWDPSTSLLLGPLTPDPTINTSGLDLLRSVVPESPHRIFIGGLPCEWGDDAVKELVAPLASIKQFNLVMDKVTGKSKGYAFFELEDDGLVDDVITALAGRKIGNKIISVRRAVEGAKTTALGVLASAGAGTVAVATLGHSHSGGPASGVSITLASMQAGLASTGGQDSVGLMTPDGGSAGPSQHGASAALLALMGGTPASGDHASGDHMPLPDGDVDHKPDLDHKSPRGGNSTGRGGARDSRRHSNSTQEDGQHHKPLADGAHPATAAPRSTQHSTRKGAQDSAEAAVTGAQLAGSGGAGASKDGPASPAGPRPHSSRGPQSVTAPAGVTTASHSFARGSAGPASIGPRPSLGTNSSGPGSQGTMAVGTPAVPVPGVATTNLQGAMSGPAPAFYGSGTPPTGSQGLTYLPTVYHHQGQPRYHSQQLHFPNPQAPGATMGPGAVQYHPVTAVQGGWAPGLAPGTFMYSLGGGPAVPGQQVRMGQSSEFGSDGYTGGGPASRSTASFRRMSSNTQQGSAAPPSGGSISAGMTRSASASQLSFGVSGPLMTDAQQHMSMGAPAQYHMQYSWGAHSPPLSPMAGDMAAQQAMHGGPDQAMPPGMHGPATLHPPSTGGPGSNSAGGGGPSVALQQHLFQQQQQQQAQHMMAMQGMSHAVPAGMAGYVRGGGGTILSGVPMQPMTQPVFFTPSPQPVVAGAYPGAFTVQSLQMQGPLPTVLPAGSYTTSVGSGGSLPGAHYPSQAGRQGGRASNGSSNNPSGAAVGGGGGGRGGRAAEESQQGP